MSGSLQSNPKKTLRTSRILGVGSYVPPRIMKNDDLKHLLDTSDEWIRQRTGIEQRHWVEGTTNNSDLALIATERALESAKLRKQDIDMIVYATLSPDHDFPGTACFLQAKLGLPGIPAIDVRQQCTGFIYALSIADQFIKTGACNKILIVGSEIHSKGVNKTPEGRDVAVLFGDGAGAVILGACEGIPGPDESQLYCTRLHADGSFAKELWIEAPTHSQDGPRLSHEIIEKGLHFPSMNGKTVFVHAVKKMPEVLLEGLQESGFTLDDVDLFIFHQANLRINEMIGKQLGIREEKIFNTIQKFGNTTAATIPLGLDEAVKAGKLKPGMLVASAAFGSGFTWASAVFRW